MIFLIPFRLNLNNDAKTQKGLIKFLFISILIFSLNFLIQSCQDSGTNPEDQNIVLPDSNLTFIPDIQRLFVVKCASRNGCHSFEDRAGDLDLTDYTSVITHEVPGVGQLVIPRNGENSILYQVLLPNSISIIERMPKGGPYLNANQTNGVKIWIDEGAVPTN